MGKPKFPWSLGLLGGIACFGLFAQFLAGEAAFELLGRGPQYSISVALFIEAAAVVAALEITRSYKEIEVGTQNWSTDEPSEIKRSFNVFAVVVEVITLTCSAMYNYTWVASVLDAHPLQIMAYAVGPLAALSGLGMTAGANLRDWQNSVAEWTLAETDAEQVQVQADLDYQRQLQAEERARQSELARLRMEAELKEQTRSAKASERIERMKLKATPAVPQATMRNPLPVAAVGVPGEAGSAEWLTVVPGSVAEFTALVAEGSIEIPEGITGAEMASAIPAINTGRTGRNWLKAARNGND